MVCKGCGASHASNKKCDYCGRWCEGTIEQVTDTPKQDKDTPEQAKYRELVRGKLNKNNEVFGLPPVSEQGLDRVVKSHQGGFGCFKENRMNKICCVGIALSFSLCCVFALLFWSTTIPQPVQDTPGIMSLALTSAWIAQTQTAISLPTSTLLSSLTPTETPTASPVPTIAFTAMPLPTLTPISLPTPTLAPYVPPAQPIYPSNLTAICNDGTYSYSKTASGACSRHGGVNMWVNHP